MFLMEHTGFLCGFKKLQHIIHDLFIVFPITVLYNNLAF